MTGQDLFDKLIYRIAKLPETSGLSFIDALNTAIEVVFLRLWYRRSDIVIASLDVSESSTPFTLPSDFRAFAEDPYLVNYAETVRTILRPLPIGGEFELSNSESNPAYYRLNGFSLHIYPYTEESVTEDLEMLDTLEMTAILEMADGTSLATKTLNGQYYSKPAEITLTGTIPWGGMFDSLIADATVQATVEGGLSSLIANSVFLATVDQALDSVLSIRANPSPRRVTYRDF